MNFLPLEIEGERVYAGFWARLLAAIVDIIVFIPIIVIFHYLQSINIRLTIFVVVFYSCLFSAYSVYFNLKYGGTIGKLITGIRITKPDGNKIQIKEALLRSSVDIFYGLVFAIAQVYAIKKVDPNAYLVAGYMERVRLTLPLHPEFMKHMDKLNEVWYWSELIVLLFNKRKRALHDFIAGTVVIKKNINEKGSDLISNKIIHRPNG